MEISELYLSRDGFLLEKKHAITSTFALRLMHVLSLSQWKKSSCWGNFWHGCAPSHQRPFAQLPPSTTLARNVSPSVAETAGACNAACPWCLVPFLAKTAGACCQTELACDVLCPRWPRLLGLAVHTVSLPAMSKPLWRNRHLACCEKISSLPAMSVPSLAVTAVGLLTKPKN